MPASSAQFATSTRRLATRMHQQPRAFQTTGFEVIDPAQKVEEERLPCYRSDEYYPVRMGEVLQSRYQVVAKLGYGVTSTVWLARDLVDGAYRTLKVHINTLTHNQEFLVFRHLASFATRTATEKATEATEATDNLGRENVRRLQDSFSLKGPHGEHDVFVMSPLGMSLRTFQNMQRGGVFPQIFVIGALDQALLGLIYLHEAEVVHTDLHADNLLIALTDDAILKTVEENEIRTPSARKPVGDQQCIYVSQYMLGGRGPLVICDFGQARIGRQHTGSAMPVPYRAPEILLGVPWDQAVDMWSVGLLAWNLLEHEDLFDVYDADSEENNTAHHLAAMTALLGPPPSAFLSRSQESRKYWDADGQWQGPVPLPPTRDLASRVQTLDGDDKTNFVSFLECCLSWLPEERLPALQLYCHPWLRGESVEAFAARVGLS
ncbi:protein kinase-like protein [Niveomyces insectorum RCEF 264]|uniref:Protein kinase-like protein n=1 Tax=Niveomyces insectorum RCEF 264 TaxID=1081102 RepID=A0A167SE70_9HYPO|nr:protein kinase-like protein [Niveomyces insectorum RCEF 264]